MKRQQGLQKRMEKRGEEEKEKRREKDERLEEGLRMCMGYIEGWGEEMKRAQKSTEVMEGNLKEGMKKWIKDLMDLNIEWRGRMRREEEKR